MWRGCTGRRVLVLASPPPPLPPQVAARNKVRAASAGTLRSLSLHCLFALLYFFTTCLY